MDRHTPRRVRPGAASDILLGAGIGAISCAIIATLLASSMMIAWCATIGAIAGAVVGLLLWIGSVDMQDEVVRPPSKDRQ